VDIRGAVFLCGDMTRAPGKSRAKSARRAATARGKKPIEL
jgi:hypothetical protein